MVQSSQRLYATPVDNPQQNRIFGKTVLNGVEENVIRKDSTHSEPSEPQDEPIHVWGVSEQKTRRYNITDGYVLFYTGNETYGYAAKILDSDPDEQIVNNIIETLTDKIPTNFSLDWYTVLYLTEPFATQIDANRFHDFAGHTRSRPFNFTRLNEQGRQAIIDDYGDFETYLKEHAQSAEVDTSGAEYTGSGVVKKNNSTEFSDHTEIVEAVNYHTNTHKQTLVDEAADLSKREIPLETVYDVMRTKYVENPESSILDVDAVGPVRCAHLYNAGYTAVEDLADASTRELTSVRSLSRDTAQVIQTHANELSRGKSTAAEITNVVDDSKAEVEQTLRAIGTAGVPRTEAVELVTRLHIRPSLLDIGGVQRRAAYHLLDRGYNTPTEVAAADPVELTDVYAIGSNNVETIQENAAQEANRTEAYTAARERANAVVSGHTHEAPDDEKGRGADSQRLASLEPDARSKVAAILGVDELDELSDAEWDAALAELFQALVESPIDININSDR